MAFDPQTYSFEEVLASSKMNQMDTNIDEVRKQHKGSSQPASLVAGVGWIDDGATPWIDKLYDGSGFIRKAEIDSSRGQYRPGISWPVEAKTSSFSVVSSDNGKIFYCTNTIGATFDPSSTLGRGFGVTFANVGSTIVDLYAASGETIDASSIYRLGSGKTTVVTADTSNRLFRVGVGGAYDLLAREASTSSVATVDIEAGDWSQYDEILLEVNHLRAANSAVTLHARLKVGGSYVTAANYAWGLLNFNQNTANNTDEGNAGDNEIVLSPSSGFSNGGDDSARLTLKIGQPGDTANWKMITYHYAATNGNNSLDGAIGGAACDDNTGAISGIRLFASAGNITAITYSLWGLKQS